MLEDIQRQLAMQLGYKVDVYHSEEHRGILAVKHNQQLVPKNIVFVMNY